MKEVRYSDVATINLVFVYWQWWWLLRKSTNRCNAPFPNCRGKQVQSGAIIHSTNEMLQKLLPAQGVTKRGSIQQKCLPGKIQMWAKAVDLAVPPWTSWRVWEYSSSPLQYWGDRSLSAWMAFSLRNLQNKALADPISFPR